MIIKEKLRELAMKNNKITLINPPWNTKYPQPPLGLASLAAVLERDHYKVEILDSNALKLSVNEIITKTSNSEIIALTAMTPTINIVMDIAKRIKEVNSDSKIIVGGPHATILPTDVLNKCSDIDVIVSGEGENTLLELVTKIENGEDINTVQGIAYRDNGKIKQTPPRTLIEDLDSLPFLAYHLLPFDKYRLHPPHGKRSPFMAMLTSRGCPYDCTFCSKSVFGSTCRYQSPKRIVNEIEYLYERFNVKEIAFYDDIFTLNKKRVYEFLNELKKRNLDIAWTCEARVNLVNRELLCEMQKSGCYMVSFGIESGNQQILDSLSKNITIQQIRDAVGATHNAGIEGVGYFMIGSPGETPDTIRDTIDFAKSLPLDYVQFSIATPFPGTKFFDYFLKLHKKSPNWDDFVYANLESGNRPVFETESLSKNDLMHLNSQAYKEFYLRFSYLTQRLRGIHSINDLKNNIKGVNMFINMIRG